METFATWLQNQLADNKLSAPEFAQLADMKLPTLWRILNEQRGAGKASVRKIARALNLPEHVVLMRAGIVSANDVVPGISADDCELLSEYRQLSDSERNIALAIVKLLKEKRPYYQSRRHWRESNDTEPS